MSEVASISKVADLAIWLSEHARTKQPVGADFNFDPDTKEYAMAFTGPVSGDESWISGVVGDEGTKALARALDLNDSVELIVFSIPEAVAVIYMMTDLEPEIILKRIKGDLESLEYTIGVQHVAHAALVDEARNILQQWRSAQQMQLPAYYKSVAEPLARLMSLPPAENPDWSIDYQDLWLKVVAKFSEEPLLMRSLVANEYPVLGRVIEALKGTYEWADLDFAFACVMWAALGGDNLYMEIAHPNQLEQLTTRNIDFDALGHNLDKTIPSVRLLANQLWNGTLQGGYGPAREFETLYGRKMAYKGGKEGPGAYLDHVLTGTVFDIRNVAAVSAVNLGAKGVSVTMIDGTEPAIMVYGLSEGDHYKFINDLGQLAKLSGPLNPVPLNPTITSLRGRHGR